MRDPLPAADDRRLRPLILGLGREDRGDDVVGRLVVRRLAAAPALRAETRELDGDAFALLAAFEGRDDVVIVDAATGGGRPGAIREFDGRRAPLPALLAGASSHGFGLAEAVELARALGRLPRRLTIHAIVGETFDLGAPVSSVAEAAVETLVATLREAWA